MEVGWFAWNFLSLIIGVPFAALFLMWTTKIFNLKDTSFKTAIRLMLITAVVTTLIYLSIFIFGYSPENVFLLQGFNVLAIIILEVFLIRELYKLKWGKTFLVLLVWYALGISITLFVLGIIFIIIAMLMVALGMPI